MFEIYPCGDHAVTLALGEGIDIHHNQKIIALYRHLTTFPPEGMLDLVPAYHTLTLIYDAPSLKKKDPLRSVYERMRNYLNHAFTQLPDTVFTTRRIEIPVCYHPSLAPDLETLAASHALGVDEVIRLHTSVDYHVYMIGFLPGFAYMGSVDEKIRTPRKTTPRKQVPKGSVGIAGEQTGIYPVESPGGWQLIGRTPWELFDAANENPCLLQPGDAVRFYPVSLDEFNKTRNA